MQLLADWVRNVKSHWPKIQSGTCRNGLASLRIWILLLIRMQLELQQKKPIPIATVNPHYHSQQMPFFSQLFNSVSILRATSKDRMSVP